MYGRQESLIRNAVEHEGLVKKEGDRNYARFCDPRLAWTLRERVAYQLAPQIEKRKQKNGGGLVVDTLECLTRPSVAYVTERREKLHSMFNLTTPFDQALYESMTLYEHRTIEDKYPPCPG